MLGPSALRWLGWKQLYLMGQKYCFVGLYSKLKVQLDFQETHLVWKVCLFSQMLCANSFGLILGDFFVIAMIFYQKLYCKIVQDKLYKLLKIPIIIILEKLCLVFFVFIKDLKKCMTWKIQDIHVDRIEKTLPFFKSLFFLKHMGLNFWEFTPKIQFLRKCWFSTYT